MNRYSFPLRFSSILASLCFAFAGAGAQASDGPLQWDQTQQSFTTEFGQEEVVATYHFTNASDQIVTIAKTSASCGCTVPTLDKTTYAPGESGALEAIFTIGSRQGMQRKIIDVVAEADGEQTSYKLALEVDIPVPVSLKPRVRFWNLGSEASTQEVQISLHEELPMTIGGVIRKDESEPANFDYQIETVEEGREYILRITPKSVAERARSVVYLTSPQDQQDILRSYPIYVYVR